MAISRQRLTINSVLKSKAKVFSFDIFDTVLTRTTATPQGIFKLMQNKMRKQVPYDIPDKLVQNFYYLRAQAEEKAKKRTKKESVTIIDIYEIISREFHLSDEIRDFLINLEISQELDAVRPIAKIIQILNFLHDRKARVVFISDMYLPKYIIQKLLEKVGAYKEGDGIYVSNGFSMTKRSGRLFRHVLKEENCLPSQMIHIGDNFTSDIMSAQHIGIQPIHFKDSQLNRYEKAVLQGKQGDSSSFDYIWESIAGASRLARFDSYIKNGSHHTLHCLGANIVGPILVGYVVWVLQEAQKCNIDRLYFCARDGQILLGIAKKIAKLLKLSIDLRYLYVSRQAVYLPASTELGDREIEWLLTQDRPLSLRIIAHRARIEPEVLLNELQRYVDKSLGIDQILQADVLEKLRMAILDAKLSSLILARAKEMRISALNYFKQEGLMDALTWGIVDIGWQGRTQDALKKMFNSTGHTERTIYGFYFGLGATKFSCADRNAKKAFFFDLDSPKRILSIGHRSVKIIEIFTTGDHGLTLSYYQDKNGIWQPKLKEPRNEKALNWGLEYFRRGIYQFLDYLYLISLNDLVNCIDHYRNSVLLLIKLLLLYPSREEAEAIGDYPYCSGLTEIDARNFAPSFSIPTALRYGFNRNYRKKNYLTCWLEATRLRSNPASQLILSHKGRAVLSRAGAISRKVLQKFK